MPILLSNLNEEDDYERDPQTVALVNIKEKVIMVLVDTGSVRSYVNQDMLGFLRTKVKINSRIVVQVQMTNDQLVAITGECLV